MVVLGGPVGRGQSLWRDRLTCHLRYLRLITRGFERWRRVGLRRRPSRMMACCQPCSG